MIVAVVVTVFGMAYKLALAVIVFVFCYGPCGPVSIILVESPVSYCYCVV